MSSTCRIFSNLDRATTSSSSSLVDRLLPLVFALERVAGIELVAVVVEERVEVGKGGCVAEEEEEKRSMIESKVLRAQDRPFRASEYAPLTYVTITII